METDENCLKTPSIRRAIRVIAKREDINAPVVQLNSLDQEQIEKFIRQVHSEIFGKKDIAFESEKMQSGLLSAISGMGTVNFKAPDAQVDTLPIWGETQTSPKGYFGEADIHIERPVLFGGNAALLGFAGFLTASYQLDGKVKCILTSILDHDAVSKAVVRLGVYCETLAKIQQRVAEDQQRSLVNVPIHPLSKQVYWESEQEETILLVPVSGDRLVAEVQRRLKEKSDSYIPQQTRISVGGTKPGNAGKVYLDNGGASLLTALPPSPQTNLLQRLHIFATCFGTDTIPYDVLQHFLYVVPKVNEDIHLSTEEKTQGRHKVLHERDAEQAAYHKLIEATLEDAHELADLIQQQGIDLDSWYQNSNPPCGKHTWQALKTWLQEGACCNDQQAMHLAEHILEKTKLFGDHPCENWKKWIKPVTVRERITDRLLEALRCY